MDKSFAIAKAGSISALARILGVSRQAVQQWGSELPELQRYRLREARPKWFAEWRKCQK